MLGLPLKFPFLIVGLVACLAFLPRAFGDSPFDAEQVEAYLARPMFQLAEALDNNERPEAAATCRQWIPPRRTDATTVFFSSVPVKLGEPSLAEPKVAEAFLNARKETSRRALQGAIRCAEQRDATLALALLWRAVREDPTSQQARKLLGLGSGNSMRVAIRPGQDAPASLGWPPRSFLVSQSKHFRIYSTASRRETTRLAEDLERFFEVWSQMFYTQWTDDETLCEKIAADQAIGLPSVVCEVVLFGDRKAYVRALGADNPAAQESTGFYSPDNKLTLLFTGEAADVETRYHEMTHQLLQECGRVAVDSPGGDSGFWVVEGIASYIESIHFTDSFATVGGWQSPRLQFSRSRWLGRAEVPTLESIMDAGRDTFQAREDLAATYTTIAAYSHLLMDDARTRGSLMQYLKGIYQGRDDPSLLTSLFSATPSSTMLSDYLSFGSGLPNAAPTGLPSIKLLCLGKSQVTAEWLQGVDPQPQLTWLDLGYLAVTSSDVARLLGDGKQLEQLNLEATKIDNSIAELLGQQRRLEELDLSQTAIGDETIESLRSLVSLETLWLTSTPITDSSVPVLLGLRNLKNLDVQNTKISEEGLSRIRKAHPNLKLNPLQLR